MGTRATIGVGTLEGGWTATLVGYDGDPWTLGTRLLDLVREHRGDLHAAWAFIAKPAAGWRQAFSEPYEEDWHHVLDTGREGPPLLCSTDAWITGAYGDGAFHLDGPSYWYLFDLPERALRVYAAPPRMELDENENPRVPVSAAPHLVTTAVFDAAGVGVFHPPLPEEED